MGNAQQQAATGEEDGARAVLAIGAAQGGVEGQADASVLGNVLPRTPYSSSAWVLGTFEETLASQSARLVGR